jgi:hypothetical protein
LNYANKSTPKRFILRYHPSSVHDEDFSADWNNTMSQTDWAKIYAQMDKRIVLKYQQLPNGEQIGKRPQTGYQQQKAPDPDVKEN